MEPVSVMHNPEWVEQAILTPVSMWFDPVRVVRPRDLSPWVSPTAIHIVPLPRYCNVISETFY